MSQPPNGGPAFPSLDQLIEAHADGSYATKPMTGGGMTLRDYFAGQSICGQMASCANLENIASVVEVARCAYALADAMIAARKLNQ